MQNLPQLYIEGSWGHACEFESNSFLEPRNTSFHHHHVAGELIKYRLTRSCELDLQTFWLIKKDTVYKAHPNLAFSTNKVLSNDSVTLNDSPIEKLYLVLRE